jgi:hypothetical protein
MSADGNGKRGRVAPGKRQVNWRIRVDLLEKAEAEAKTRNVTVPVIIQEILAGYYYPVK